MPLIFPASGAKVPAAFSIDNSCRFFGDTALNKTATSDSPTLATKATISFWIKNCSETNDPAHNICYTNGAVSPYFNCMMPGDDGTGPVIYIQNAGTSNSNLYTTQFVRDPAAWQHFVYSYDTTPSTPSSSSIRLFLNGVQVTAFNTGTYPSQSVVSGLTKASQAWYIGANYNGSANFLNGYLAEFMVVDGQALAATSFGEFDEDSPSIWKPIDISGITLGNQGFYLDFKASGNMGNDVGGGTDFTETNIAAADQATDTPTNNFCTMNPLDNYYAAMTFSEGNCKTVTTGSKSYVTGTIGLSAGKWYWEVKVATEAAGAFSMIGIADTPATGTTTNFALGYTATTWCYYGYDGGYRNSNSTTSYGDAYAATSDIIGVYLDLDNNKLYFAKNGTVQNSGTGISITAPASLTSGAYFPATNYWDDGVATYEHNFGGSPSFTVSSAVADTNGYGAFEYDPSAGTFDSASKDFLAICTKNLGSDGG